MNVDSKIARAEERPETLIDDREGWDRATVRRVAMVIVPLIGVVIGIAFYLWSGRYVETDNAYVKADIASLSPQASGEIIDVLVGENQLVKAGQPLFNIEQNVYKIAVAEGQAGLRSATDSINAEKAQLQQKEAALGMAQSDLAFADRELKRQTQLAARDFAAAAKLDEARHASDVAQQHIAFLKQERAEILAKLDGNPELPIDQYAAYQEAGAKIAAAQNMLDHTTVYAPFDGIVSHVPKRGDYARTGVPALSIVSVSNVWIEANYKETELTHVHVGQPVEISVDTYPDRAFHGHVQSISQASGSEFAILPAQNSTGNWVKVVQRIPVRIAIDDDSATSPVLRAGMSVEATVDSGRRRYQRMFSADEPAR
jgi:membrane fusion protein (multidrug efflux system)